MVTKTSIIDFFSRGKLQNIQSDTFLLAIQNKKTNIETKQDEYVNVSTFTHYRERIINAFLI